MSNDLFDKWFNHFSQTGQISPISLGQTRDEVKAILGEPHDVSAPHKKTKQSAIWVYGDLEFHFGNKQMDALSLIFSEKFLEGFDEGVVKISISCMGK